MERRKRTATVAAVLGLAVVALSWTLFAPSALGGSAGYAVVYGSSMEPAFHRGDLAVLRPSDSYSVGDVVAYRSEKLGRTVMHRIVGKDGARYVFQGDNNDFVDPDRPLAGELLGEHWLRVPVAGSLFEWLRVPLHAALVVGLVALVATGTGTARGRRTARRAGTRIGTGGPMLSRNPYAAPALAIVLLAAIVLGIVAFGRSTTRAVTDPALYTQHGTFSYGADVSEASIYADGRADTGEPVFTRLATTVDVGFAYELDSLLPASVGGSAALAAQLSDGAGWSKTIPLASERRFDGRTVRLTGTLDLRALRREVERFERQTGAHLDSYLVSVTPTVVLEGSVGGQDVSDLFAPALDLRLDPVRLAPANPGPAEQGSPFEKAKSGEGVRVLPAQLSFGRFQPEVGTARALAVGLGVAAALGLLALGRARRRVLASDEPTRIEARHGGWLVPLAAPRRSHETVRVASFDGLVRLAERQDRPILHARDGDTHVYSVEEGGVTYVYQASAGANAERPARLQPPWKLQRGPAR